MRDLRRALADALGRPVAELRAVPGGDLNEAFAARLDDGDRVFVKTRAGAAPGEFATEADGLRWLADAGALRVAEVVAVGEDWLALHWIDRGRLDAAGEEELGRGLAALHRAGAPACGGPRPLRIGPLELPNDPADDWPSFYAERRLLPLADRAGLGAVVGRLCARLDALVGPAEPPARLHGDLWSGNVLAGADGRPWLIDPAAYGGHREVDLAMLALFGAPSRRTLAAYDEAWPRADGHEERLALYQLFPLLVHAVLVGGGYAGGGRGRGPSVSRPTSVSAERAGRPRYRARMPDRAPGSALLRRRDWLPPPRAGEVALVTGASSGIGAELARALGRRGHAVVLVARRGERLSDLARELADSGAGAWPMPCDLSEPDARERLVEEIGDRGWTVSVLCNNAGFGLPGHVAVVPGADHLRLLRLNVEATVDLCRRFVPGMAARGRGAVLNVCSLSSFVPWPAMATYGASKAAALSFTEALHTELRPAGVAVTAVCPGFVRTDFIEVAGLTEAAATAPSWIYETPRDVAEHGIRALQRNRRVAVHSLMYRSGAVALRVLPNGVTMTVLDRWSPFRRDGAVARGRSVPLREA